MCIRDRRTVGLDGKSYSRKRALPDLSADPAYQASQYRKALIKHLESAIAVRGYEPDRVVEVADAELLRVIETTCDGIAKWRDEIRGLRGRGLRAVDGGLA